MNKRLLTLSVLLAAGCSSSGGGGGTGTTPNPANKDQAIAALTDGQKQAFARWQKSPLKSCDPAEAFGLEGTSNEVSGLDVDAVQAANGGSLIFTDGKGGFALATPGDSLQGTSAATSEESVSVNGTTQTFSARADRSGSTCVINLYGQEVARVSIAANFQVVAESLSGQPVKHAIEQATTYATATGDSVRAVQPALFALVTDAVMPSKLGVALVAKALGLTTNQQTNLLGYSGFPLKYSLRAQGDKNAVWTNSYEEGLIASNDVAHGLFDRPSAQPLEIRLPMSGGTIAAKLVVQSSPTQLSATSLQFDSFKRFDDREAAECVAGRVAALSRLQQDNRIVQPSISRAESACAEFTGDIATASRATLKSVLPSVLAGKSGGQMLDWGGWDSLAQDLAIAAVKSGQDVQAAIDPQMQSPVLEAVAANVQSLSKSLATKSNLASQREALTDLGVSWAFGGQKVSAARVEQILSAANNIADTFPAATEQFLRAYADAPNSNDSMMTAANAVTSDEKTAALQADALAKDLGYGDTFERNVMSKVLSSGETVDTFKQWTSTLTSLKSLFAKYQRLGAFRSQLVGDAVGWMSAGIATDKADSWLSALDNVAETFPNSTAELVGHLDNVMPISEQHLAFAASINDDYKNTAKAYVLAAQKLGYAEQAKKKFDNTLQDQPSLENIHAYNESLNAASAYFDRETQRGEEFASESDRQSVLDRGVSELWIGQYAALEQIAPLAKFEPQCQRHTLMSTLAECGSRQLFSTAKGMLFDPAFGDRYVTLARDMQSVLTPVAGNFDNVASEAVRAYFGSFGPIWSKCDNTAFAAKAAELHGELQQYVSSQDMSVMMRLMETVRDCE